jgi:RNA polymerase sigma factor (sigma-70 family)
MTMVDDGVLRTAQASEDDRRARLAGLVIAAQKGHQEAIDDLVTELSPVLWHVARACGLGPSDAEDVLQTVWLSLLSHLQAIHTPAALTGWLVITTRREAWRVRKADSQQAPAEQEWLISIPDPRPGSEEQAIMAEECRQLWAAFLTLPQRCQELLRIVAFVPRPDYDEVAAALDMPRGSVGPTRGRCLDKLRAALGVEGERR